MGNAFVKVIRIITGFFNRVIDREAQRVDEFNRHYFEEAGT